MQEGRERHQVDVDGEQDQLDRHQNDDDVLAVDENAEDAEREQDRADREIVSKPDRHRVSPQIPCPGRTWRISIAVAGVRAFCAETLCRRTLVLWRSVSTIAPTIATSSTSPAS